MAARRWVAERRRAPGRRFRPGVWLLLVAVPACIDRDGLPAPTVDDALERGWIRVGEPLGPVPGSSRIAAFERVEGGRWLVEVEEVGVAEAVPWEVRIAAQDSLILLSGERFAESLHQGLLDYTMVPGLPDSLRQRVVRGETLELRELQIHFLRPEMAGYLTRRWVAVRTRDGWIVEDGASGSGLLMAAARVSYAAAPAVVPEARACAEQEMEERRGCVVEALRAHYRAEGEG